MDYFDICVHKISYDKYMFSKSNSAAIEGLRYVLPVIIENELTSKQRECVRMKYFEHKTQQEIAQSMNVSQGAVSRCLNAARKTINRYLRYALLSANKVRSELS